MKPRTWQTVRRILEQAREMSTDERTAFLDASCADADVRTEVERLLALEDDGVEQEFLESPDAPSAGDVRDGAPGTRIGGFVLGTVLGEGGMGTVYEAEQDTPRRRVALKLLRSALASPSARRRFANEANLLARLRHPGIAQVYEAGIATEGALQTPWFAMELVESAQDVVSFCRERGLSVSARLELFVAICDAVHGGHQNGVIHRDIKPGNLLVDRSGRPKVIDFGVARATDGELDGTRHTRAGEVVGTLQYMSPEQLLGDVHAVDTRTDVYALGAVLYELLCDRAPHDLAGKSLAEVSRIVRDETPIAPTRLVPSLAPDVDWIALKAMEKEPSRRYASASELAADVSRLLAHEPVLAGPPSASYRMRKFVRRHRFGVTAGAAVLVSLLAAVTGTTLGMLEAGRQRDSAEDARADAEAARADAEAEATKAGTVVDFMIDLFETPDPARLGPDARVIDALVGMEGRAAEAFARQPDVESYLRYAMGRLYSNLGRDAAGEEHLRAALALRRREYGEDDLRTLATLDALGTVLMRSGRLEEADDALTAVHTRLAAAATPDAHQALQSLNSLAMLRHRQARFEEAEVLHRQSIEGHAALYGVDHELTLQTRANLGSLLQELGRLDEAAELLAPTVERMRAILGAGHPRTVNTMSNLATLRIQQSRLEEAAALLDEVLEGRRRILPAEHPDLLGSLTNLASLCFVNGDLERAETLFREVLAVRDRHFPPGDPDTVVVLCNLPNVLYYRGDHDGVRAMVARLRELRLGASADNLRVLRSVEQLSLALESWGMAEEAGALVADVLEGRRRIAPDDGTSIAELEQRLERLGRSDR